MSLGLRCQTANWPQGSLSKLSGSVRAGTWGSRGRRAAEWPCQGCARAGTGPQLAPDSLLPGQGQRGGLARPWLPSCPPRPPVCPRAASLPLLPLSFLLTFLPCPPPSPSRVPRMCLGWLACRPGYRHVSGCGGRAPVGGVVVGAGVGPLAAARLPQPHPPLPSPDPVGDWPGGVAGWCLRSNYVKC